MNTCPDELRGFEEEEGGTSFSQYRMVLAGDIVATISAWGIGAEVIGRLVNTKPGPVMLGSVLSEVELRQKMPPLVVYVDGCHCGSERGRRGGFDLLSPGDAGFRLELDDRSLDGARQAWETVRHLAEKSWVGKETLLQLAGAAIAEIDRRVESQAVT